jgi:hypothetical protein
LAEGKIWRTANRSRIIPGMTAEQEIIGVLRAAAERELPSLLIGANAVLLLGYVRNTIDLDLLVPEQSRAGWLDLMRQLGYRFFHGTKSFAQFESRDKTGPPVDLMFVEDETWEKLLEGAKEMRLASERVRLPRPEYLVALKLHAAASPTRSKPELDWEDIRQIIRICRLDPTEESFRALILRYGGQDALARIEGFSREE